MARPIALEDAHQMILGKVQRIDRTDEVPLDSALDRVLREDVFAPLDLPPFRSSAMDGYALRKLGQSYRVAGVSLAGQPFSGKLKDGECVRIFTGAMLPEDADTVVAQEVVMLEGERIHLDKDVEIGAHVRPSGLDCQKGQLLLPAGTRLTPPAIGLLASTGINKLKCTARVKVALAANGDELVKPALPLPAGCIYESSLPMVQSLLARLACEVTGAECMPDDPVRISFGLQALADKSEVVISIGGASVGDTDFIKPVLAESGSIHFWRIALKPGMPMIFGQLKGAVFFGLPGNPASTFVTFTELVAPCLAKMGGAEVSKPLEFEATLGSALYKDTDRAEFQRASMRMDETGGWRVYPAQNQSSNSLRSLAFANCYIVLKPSQGSLEAGEKVRVRTLSGFI